MLATIKSKLMLLALVGTTWLASYSTCDTGGIYGAMGGYYDSIGGYFVDEGGYYVDPYWNGYAYEPYLGDYYEAAPCCEPYYY